jgi:ferredoxin
MPTIKFTKENKTVDVETGTNLRTAAIRAGVQLYTFPHTLTGGCMGLGQCGTCRVHVKKGQENLSRQGLWERLRLSFIDTWFHRLGNEAQLRLACQTTVQGDCEIETKPAPNYHGERFWG